jgi:hypothetical protein
MYQHQFTVGRTYLTEAGKPVKIIAENEPSMWPHYRCVQGDDGEGRWCEDWDRVTHERITVWVPGNTLGWRYDRENDVGRCTGRERDERALLPGAIDLPVDGIGAYFAEKFAVSVKERGVFQTARNMRKQGVPIHVVLSLLRLNK